MNELGSNMKNLPLITVIIPVYNIKEYLPRCVHSVTAQTYPHLEVLLVDDGSTDGTGELCDKLAAEDVRIRTYHKKNGGSSSARNMGLELAEGEYVGFVDSDDYIEPDMYEKLWQAMQKTGSTIAQIGREEIDEQGNPLPDICVPPAEAVEYSSGEFMKELLLHKGDCSFCTKLIRRDIFGDRRFPEGKLNEDFSLLIRFLAEGNRVYSLPDRGYHVFYRMGSNSRREDKNDFSRVYADSVENADVVTHIVEEQFPELRDVALRFGVFQRIEYLLHIPISEMTGDNEFYRKVVKNLRQNWVRGMRNPILTGKNKLYQTIFAVAPRTARVLHKRLKKL